MADHFDTTTAEQTDVVITGGVHNYTITVYAIGDPANGKIGGVNVRKASTSLKILHYEGTARETWIDPVTRVPHADFAVYDAAWDRYAEDQVAV